MSLIDKNRMALRVALGFCLAGLILWCASAFLGGKPSDRCPKSPDGQHEYMRDGTGYSECWYCEKPEPK